MVIVAEEQTAGKGRLDRYWISPKGCVSLSIILYPDIKLLPSLIMVASVAMIHTIKKVTGLKASIKWPNDILINGKKVGGILIEGTIQHINVGYAVVGVGLNVNFNISDYPEISEIATTLSDEMGKPVSLLDIIRTLLIEFEKLYKSALDGDMVYREWHDNMDTIGKKVSAKSGNIIYEGIVDDVTKDGNLIIKTSAGETVNFIAGDVILLK